MPESLRRKVPGAGANYFGFFYSSSFKDAGAWFFAAHGRHPRSIQELEEYYFLPHVLQDEFGAPRRVVEIGPDQIPAEGVIGIRFGATETEVVWRRDALTTALAGGPIPHAEMEESGLMHRERLGIVPTDDPTWPLRHIRSMLMSELGFYWQAFGELPPDAAALYQTFEIAPALREVPLADSSTARAPYLSLEVVPGTRFARFTIVSGSGDPDVYVVQCKTRPGKDAFSIGGLRGLPPPDPVLWQPFLLYEIDH